MRVLGGIIAVWLALAGPLAAAPAGLDVAASSVTAEGRRAPHPLVVELAFGRALPYRTLILDAPPRLVIDLDEARFGTATPEALTGAALLPALRWGEIAPGRARLVAELPGPMHLTSAETTPEGRLRLRLVPVAPEDFAPDGREAALPQLWDLPEPAPVAPVAERAPGPLRVAIDPGHGGFDPGAQAGGVSEAALMLTLAHEVAAALRARGAEPVLTRDADVFLPLHARIRAARAARTDLLVSLHADALPEGAAAGAAVFVWGRDAHDAAARSLAQSHDRDTLLAGLAPEPTGSDVAEALVGLARVDTGPRSENIARFVVSRLALGELAIHKHPVKAADFAVLTAPDLPSVLVETGFLTDPTDRANLTDPAWRARLAEALADAALSWAEDDTARAPLLRR